MKDGRKKERKKEKERKNKPQICLLPASVRVYYDQNVTNVTAILSHWLVKMK